MRRRHWKRTCLHTGRQVQSADFAKINCNAAGLQPSVYHVQQHAEHVKHAGQRRSNSCSGQRAGWVEEGLGGLPCKQLSSKAHIWVEAAGQSRMPRMIAVISVWQEAMQLRTRLATVAEVFNTAQVVRPPLPAAALR